MPKLSLILVFNNLQMACLLLKGRRDQKAMLRIKRSSDRGVVLSLSGRIEIEDVAELQRLLSLEAVDQGIALDLKDITLVDRDALKFLARCEAESIKLENCPAYIREWIDTERGRGRHKRRTAKRESTRFDQL